MQNLPRFLLAHLLALHCLQKSIASFYSIASVHKTFAWRCSSSCSGRVETYTVIPNWFPASLSPLTGFSSVYLLHPPPAVLSIADAYGLRLSLGQAVSIVVLGIFYTQVAVLFAAWFGRFFLPIMPSFSWQRSPLLHDDEGEVALLGRRQHKHWRRSFEL